MAVYKSIFEEDETKLVLNVDIVPDKGKKSEAVGIYELNDEEKDMLLGNLCERIRRMENKR